MLALSMPFFASSWTESTRMVVISMFARKNKKTGEDLDRYYFKFREETVRGYFKNFEEIRVIREEKNIIMIGKLV